MKNPNSCVFIKRRKNVPVAYLLLYVDDMLIATANMQKIELMKKGLELEIDMKDLGDTKTILGMDIVRRGHEKKFWLTDKDYICKDLKRFQLDKSKSISVPLGQQFKLNVNQRLETAAQRKEMDRIPYARIVGSVKYTMVCTRPDVSHAISVASRFMADPAIEH